MVFHWSLCDSKSPQVSRTRLRILALLRNAVVWIVSTRPPTYKSSRPFNYPLVIVPKAPITIGTIVTFMFHSFFNSLARSRYLSFFSLSFRFILWSAGTAKSTILQILFLFFFFFVGYYEVWSSGRVDNAGVHTNVNRLISIIITKKVIIITQKVLLLLLILILIIIIMIIIIISKCRLCGDRDETINHIMLQISAEGI